VRLVLWDERQRRLISFRELHTVMSAKESDEESQAAQFLARKRSPRLSPGPLRSAESGNRSHRGTLGSPNLWP
jgi:hypothetical protein